MNRRGFLKVSLASAVAASASAYGLSLSASDYEEHFGEVLWSSYYNLSKICWMHTATYKAGGEIRNVGAYSEAERITPELKKNMAEAILRNHPQLEYVL